MSLVSLPIAVQSLTSTTTILIVEDAETDRAVYIRYLRDDTNFNYQILEAETLAEGLEFWRSPKVLFGQSQRPDLVILDINLPDGSGLELLEAIAETYPAQKLPIIVITEQGNEMLALEAMKRGASDYLNKKNITKTALCRSVATVISQWTLSYKLEQLQKQEAIIAQIALNIRQFSNLEDICRAVVTDVRAFLQCDRVIVYQFNSNTSGHILAESVISPWKSYLHTQIADTCLQENIRFAYQQQKTFACSDIYTANLTDCHRQMLEGFQVRANLVVPIFLPNSLDQTVSVWGLLIAHQCSGPRIWKETDFEFFQRLVVQLAIAIQQAELYQNLQNLNFSLEQKVEQRTHELQFLLEQYQQAETTLRFQARILDEIYDAVISIDLNGIIYTWNKGAIKLFGYQPEEVIGQNMSILCDDAFQISPEILKLILAKGEHEIEAIILSKFGEYRHISLRISVFLDKERKIFRLLGCANDVSDRKRAEEELRITTERLTMALKSARIGCWEWDLVKNIPLWDERMYELYGIDKKSNSRLECETWANALHPDDLPATEALLQRAIAGEAVYDTEFRVVHPDGNIHFIKAYGIVIRDAKTNPQSVIGVNFDISDHKRAEAGLKEFNRRWRSVLDDIQMIVIEFDRAGIVRYINPFFQKISEFTTEDVIGKHWITNFVPSHLSLSLETTFQEILQETNNPYFVNPILTKSGKERMIGWRNSVLKNNAGYSIGIVAIGEDITEQYRLERVKSEFLAIVSHELKTPLTTIQASLSLFSEKIIDLTSEAGEEVMKIATDGIDRVVRLVNDILDVERLESGKLHLKKSNCNTQKIMTDAIAQVQELAKQANIKINMSSDSFVLFADADRLVQVLINLLSNAIKFSPPFSTIDLSVEQKTPESWDQLNSQTYLLFTIRDRGRGIPSQNLESIFERFHQVDSSDAREQGGTGLGLAISREIVEQHGGKIWVKSLLGKGSTFYFTVDYCKNK